MAETHVSAEISHIYPLVASTSIRFVSPLQFSALRAEKTNRTVKRRY